MRAIVPKSIQLIHLIVVISRRVSNSVHMAGEGGKTFWAIGYFTVFPAINLDGKRLV